MPTRILYPTAVLALLAAAACDRIPTQPPAVAGSAGPSTATEVRSACLDEPIPEGFVILKYEATSQCPYRNGFWNARRIGKPEWWDVMCRDSPTPAGWLHTEYLHSDECRFAATSQQNAVMIFPSIYWDVDACLAGPIPPAMVRYSYSRRPNCPGYADGTRFNAALVGNYQHYPPDYPFVLCASGPLPQAPQVSFGRRSDCPGYADSTRFNSVIVVETDWEWEPLMFTVCATSPVIPWGIHVEYGRRPDCRGYADTTRFNTLTVRYPHASLESAFACRNGPHPDDWEIVSYAYTPNCPGGTQPNGMHIVLSGLPGSDVVCMGSPGIDRYAHVAFSATAACGSPRVTNTVTLSWDPQPGDTICASSPQTPEDAEPARSRKCRSYSATGYNAWVLGPGARSMGPGRPSPSRSAPRARRGNIEWKPGDLRIPPPVIRRRNPSA